MFSVFHKISEGVKNNKMIELITGAIEKFVNE